MSKEFSGGLEGPSPGEGEGAGGGAWGVQAMMVDFLREGGENKEAAMVHRGRLEAGGVRFYLNNRAAHDYTLRMSRKDLETLERGMKPGQESLGQQRIRRALEKSLPAGKCAATFEVRGGLNGGTVLRVVVKAGAPVKPTRKPWVPPAGSETMGCLTWLRDFMVVWVAGRRFNLRRRRLIRLCLAYLVEHKAFTPDTARDFKLEIDRQVRAVANLPRPANGRIDDYFNDRDNELPKLRQLLIHEGTKPGSYYLKVQLTND